MTLRRLSGATPVLSQALQALYLRLLANSTFKSAFADAFARHYDLIARHFMASSYDDGLVFGSQISVQFFNRPGIVVPLVRDPHVSLLRRMLTLTARLIRGMTRDPSALGADSLLDRKRYAPLVADLRFVLAIGTIGSSLTTSASSPRGRSSSRRSRASTRSSVRSASTSSTSTTGGSAASTSSSASSPSSA